MLKTPKPPNTAKREAAPTWRKTGISAHIVGWGMAVPEMVMSNDDLSAFVETSDEWIRERTGIRQRYIASERESTATLAHKAALAALEVANILPSELELIIVATSTPEHTFPSTASLVQDWLGAGRAGAFDLSAACSGFVYALDMAAQAIRSGSKRNALVIGAETMSRILDWQDRGTCILFGDGAGAVILSAGEEEGGVLASLLRSDGAGCDVLSLPTPNVLDANGHKIGKMYMLGSEVFKFATRVVDESLRQVAEYAGVNLEEVRLIVPHQANQRIIASAAKKLKLEESRFMSNVDKYGNTSAASIPIALCEAVQQGKIQDDDYVAFVGFGGGLAWAAMLVKWGVPASLRQTPTLAKQRRLASYTLARWRTRLQRWQRSLSLALRRLSPWRWMRLRQAKRSSQHKD